MGFTHKQEKPLLVAMDLEGCLVPEIWIGLAESTNIAAFKLTTRDIADYNVLMRQRLEIMQQHKLSLIDLQKVITQLEPLAEARTFLDWLRSQIPVIILSDTFYEFAKPLIQKLGYPTLFCHTLSIDQHNYISDYHLRVRNGKARAVKGFRRNGFTVIAIGDSHNDIKNAKSCQLWDTSPCSRKHTS